MIEANGAEEEDTHTTEEDLPQAAGGMQTNGISSEKLEEGELEEESESAQAYPNEGLKGTFHVRKQRMRFRFSMAHVSLGAFNYRVRAQATPSDCKHCGESARKARDA